MKCHAGVQFDSGKPCPKCNAKLGEVCWPGINADLAELPLLREENARLRKALRYIANEGDHISRGAICDKANAALALAPATCATAAEDAT